MLLTAFPLSLADRRLIHGVDVDLGLQAQTRYTGSYQFLTVQQSTAWLPEGSVATTWISSTLPGSAGAL